MDSGRLRLVSQGKGGCTDLMVKGGEGVREAGKKGGGEGVGLLHFFPLFVSSLTFKPP